VTDARHIGCVPSLLSLFAANGNRAIARTRAEEAAQRTQLREWTAAIAALLLAACAVVYLWDGVPAGDGSGPARKLQTPRPRGWDTDPRTLEAVQPEIPLPKLAPAAPPAAPPEGAAAAGGEDASARTDAAAPTSA
jgi:hypothetical protein